MKTHNCLLLQRKVSPLASLSPMGKQRKDGQVERQPSNYKVRQMDLLETTGRPPRTPDGLPALLGVHSQRTGHVYHILQEKDSLVDLTIPCGVLMKSCGQQFWREWLLVVGKGFLIATLPKDTFVDHWNKQAQSWPPRQIFLLPLKGFFFLQLYQIQLIQTVNEK